MKIEADIKGGWSPELPGRNIWKPTMNLRWRELPLWEHQETGEVKILEQEWINNLGEVEWREIPTVD